MKMKSKIICAALCSVLILPLAACGAPKDEAVTLNVYNWGDYINPDVLTKFTEETGIKVNYETFATNEDMYVKIKKAAGIMTSPSLPIT